METISSPKGRVKKFFIEISGIKQLAQNICDELKPIREKRAYYEEHPEIVDKILIEGTAKAQKVAKETMKKVKNAMKLNYFMQ